MAEDTFAVSEATIADIHAAMAAGEVTAVTLTETYLDRIEALDGALSAILAVNPDAEERAADLDRALEDDGPVGPLHGIPVVLKDNFDTADLPTTAGSAALDGVRPPDDATTVTRIRDAGGIVLAKANMHEFAYGWETVSSLGGRTRNPYDTDRIPGGSSGGTAAAIAANMAAVGTGSDTYGSVRVPPAFTNLVGIRPTQGLVSRDGIVPMSTTQDVPGPICRTVADAAIMLDVMAGFDPADPTTARGRNATPADGEPPITTWPGEGDSETDRGGSYANFPDPDGLCGARLGVLEECIEPDGIGAAVTDVIETALSDAEAAGAETVDPVEVPVDVTPATVRESSVLVYEFRRELDGYLAGLDDPDAPSDLEEIVASGAPADAVIDLLRETLSVDVDALDENADYLGLLANRGELGAVDGVPPGPSLRDALLAALESHDLDALVYPTVSRPPVAVGDRQSAESVMAGLSACSGLPAITVPAGFTDHPDAPGLPVGIEFLGRRFDEPRLVELASAYESATDHRRPPRL